MIEIFEGGVWFGRPDGLWYWRLRARNGKIIADGSEGYVSRSNALRAARRAKKLMAKAEIA